MNSALRKAPDWNEWQRAILRHIQEALAAGAGASMPENEDIHRFRSALKFARALLRMAPHSIAAEATSIRRELGKTARRLSRTRDRFVFLETLNSLSKGHIEAPSQALSKKSAEKLVQVRQSLPRLEHQLNALATPPEPTVELLVALKRCKQRMEKRCPKDWTTASATEIHAYRSALVVASCQAIFLNSLTGHPKRSCLSRFNRLRKYLGEFNDLDRFLNLSKAPRFSFSAEMITALRHQARKRQKFLRRKLEKLI